MARVSGGAKKMHPLSWGGGGKTGKDPKSQFKENHSRARVNI